MKHVKHCLFAAAATLLLLLALGGPAFAYTITVNPGNQPTTGHSYNAYQIFSGSYTSTGEMTGVNWPENSGDFGKNVAQGLNSNKNYFSQAVQDKLTATPPSVESTQKSAGEVANAIDVINGNSDDAKLFAKIVKQAIDTTSSPQPTALTYNGGVYSADVPTGYYLIVDSTTSTSGVENDFVSDLILKVAGENVSVSPKGNVPSVVKKVKENNTTDGTWQDAADYHINDVVPFQLTGTLPGDYDRYSTYTYTFTDTYSAGLTPDLNTIRVYFDKDGNTADTSDKTEITRSMNTPTSGTGTFTVSFTDLKIANSQINSNSKIIVEYSARLNENAVIGTSASNENSGNPNTVKLTYSNNPNSAGTGDTPTDTVFVFTYELDVDKVNRDNHNDKVIGAQFILYSNAKNKYAIVESNKVTGWVDNENQATRLTSDSLGKFTVIGLDAGTYNLTEKVAPTGYVLPANPDTVFTITSTLASEATTVDTAITDLKVNSQANLTMNADKGTGKVNLTVTNARSGSLPSTGSMGMFIMIGIGICLMAGAGIYLLKNRNKA